MCKDHVFCNNDSFVQKSENRSNYWDKLGIILRTIDSLLRNITGY